VQYWGSSPAGSSSVGPLPARRSSVYQPIALIAYGTSEIRHGSQVDNDKNGAIRGVAEYREHIESILRSKIEQRTTV
jgi:hypothetical protein